MATDEDWMREAIEEAIVGMRADHGGPFGAVIVRRGEKLASAHNRVLSTQDPTAHAEILAIRETCRILGQFQLDECDLYTSCEPCPMCLGAIYWARLRRVFYGSTRHEADRIGFSDLRLYQEIQAAPADRQIPMHPLLAKESWEAMREWERKPDRQMY